MFKNNNLIINILKLAQQLLISLQALVTITTGVLFTGVIYLIFLKGFQNDD